MARRKSRKPVLGGEIIIKCPHGHTLAEVASDSPLRGSLVPLGVGENLSWRHETLPEVLANPLALRCVKCQQAGRNADYRGDWEKVKDLADQLERRALGDFYSDSRRVYVIGG